MVTLALTPEHLQLLLQTSEILGSTLDLPTILDGLMDQVVDAIGAERGFVMLAAEEGEGWRVRSARAIDASVLDADDFRISQGVIGRVAREGTSILTSDAFEDPRLREQASISLHGLKSILCVPLALRGRILGVIYADHTMDRGVFQPHHRVLLESIARSAAMAIENARLYERLQRRHEEALAEARSELAAAEAQLAHAARMATVGRLAAGVAHEINTPLSAVALNASALLDVVQEPRDRRRLDLVLRAVERCRHIISNLLRYAHKGARPQEEIAVDTVLDDAWTLVEHDADRHGIGLTRGGTRGLRVRGRAADLVGVVVNLLMNACDALQTLPPNRPRTIDVDVSADDAKTRITIRDSGPGVAPEALSHLFEPFFTTRPPGQGLGLGLSISWQLVADHGGELTVASTAAGATFTVCLPSG